MLRSQGDVGNLLKNLSTRLGLTCTPTENKSRTEVNFYGIFVNPSYGTDNSEITCSRITKDYHTTRLPY